MCIASFAIIGIHAARTFCGVAIWASLFRSARPLALSLRLPLDRGVTGALSLFYHNKKREVGIVTASAQSPIARRSPVAPRVGQTLAIVLPQHRRWRWRALQAGEQERTIRILREQYGECGRTQSRKRRRTGATGKTTLIRDRFNRLNCRSSPGPCELS